MKEQKYHIYLTEQERSEVIKSLIDLKNTLIRQGKYTDAVDDVLLKLFISTPAFKTFSRAAISGQKSALVSL